MHPSLLRCLSMIESATAGLDDDRAARRVDGRWSIAEIVEHLDRTYTGTTKGFERYLSGQAPPASPATFRTRARKWVVVTLGFFPAGVDAPRHVVPTGAIALSAVLARLRRHVEALDEAAGRVVAERAHAPLLDHPVLGPFTVADWMRFHEVHTRHHQRQIIDRRGARPAGGAPEATAVSERSRTERG